MFSRYVHSSKPPPFPWYNRVSPRPKIECWNALRAKTNKKFEWHEVEILVHIDVLLSLVQMHPPGSLLLSSLTLWKSSYIKIIVRSSSLPASGFVESMATFHQQVKSPFIRWWLRLQKASQPQLLSPHLSVLRNKSISPALWKSNTNSIHYIPKGVHIPASLLFPHLLRILKSEVVSYQGYQRRGFGQVVVHW